MKSIGKRDEKAVPDLIPDNAIKALMFVGAATIVLGMSLDSFGAAPGTVAPVIGLGGLLLFVSLGLKIALSETTKGRCSDGSRDVPGTVEIAGLAKELGRPLFSGRAIIVLVCLIVTPLAAAWLLRSYQALLGLAFPVVFAGTIAIAGLVKKYALTRRALIALLSEGEKQQFLSDRPSC
ncbi:MAG TPA: hypothetical protein VEP30_05020 [Chthoniobacterales bacterium]|nr:hypothetical protein [Chthoniobacterales bacterium]